MPIFTAMTKIVKKGRGRPKMSEKVKKVNVGLKLRPNVIEYLKAIKGLGGSVNDLIEAAILEKYFK